MKTYSSHLRDFADSDSFTLALLSNVSVDSVSMLESSTLLNVVESILSETSDNGVGLIGIVSSECANNLWIKIIFIWIVLKNYVKIKVDLTRIKSFKLINTLIITEI